MIKLFFSKTINPKQYSRDFVNNILARELCLDKEKIIIDTTQYGKPYIKHPKGFHFNISHTKDIIVCGLSDSPIGVDIEKIKPIKKKIVEKFFNLHEKAYVYSDLEKKDDRFTEIWTRKEAYVKWIGKGMEVGFDIFDVANDTRIKTMHIDNYILSVCTDNISDKSIETYIIA